MIIAEITFYIALGVAAVSFFIFYLVKKGKI